LFDADRPTAPADLRALIEHLHRTEFTAALSIAMWHSMRWSPTGLLREQATQTEGKGIIPLRNGTPQCGFRIAERSAKKLLTWESAYSRAKPCQYWHQLERVKGTSSCSQLVD